GSGKTEAFLLPLLARLFRAPRAPGARGVRAILLYPLNALVNDQVERLYRWLHGQEDVRLFHLNSEVPEDARRANERGWPRFDACRFRTRQHARGREDADGRKIEHGPVPDVLVTNYSMLEYMLCRPQDAPFFGSALEAVVLDEAHLYSGVLAAEISLLLRRVYARCGRKARDVLGLAVSATLGGQPDDLRRFVGGLFSRPPEAVRAVSGRPAPVAPPPSVPPDVERDLAAHLAADDWPRVPTLVPGETPDGEAGVVLNSPPPEALDALEGRLRPLVGDAVLAEARASCGGRAAPFLHQALRRAPLAERLHRLLSARRSAPLAELAGELFPAAENSAQAQRACLRLLQLTAAARPAVDEHPFLPHRLHLVVRAADGASVCLNPDCPEGEARGVAPRRLGALWADALERCPSCRSRCLALATCGECGVPALVGQSREGVILPALVRRGRFVGGELLSWEEPVTDDREDPPQEIVVDPHSGELCGFRDPGARLWSSKRCPLCASKLERWLPFASARSLVPIVVAETLLASLPPNPTPEQHHLPARGRRLLAFSDSRRSAARLGPTLRVLHETYVARRALAGALRDHCPPSAQDLAELEEELAETRQRLANPRSEFEARRLSRRVEDLERDLAAARGEGFLEQWAEVVAARPELAELFDPALGQEHEADRWFEAGFWQRNHERARERALELLQDHLAFRPRRGASLEGLGLVEVLYPELEALDFPSELYLEISRAQARERIREVRTDFLAALLDDLRTEGCVTLGSRDRDQNHPFAHRALGRYCSLEREGVLLVPFAGKSERHRRRLFAAAVLEAAGLRREEAVQAARPLLRGAFRLLLGAARREDAFPWLESDDVLPVRQSARRRRRASREARPREFTEGFRLRLDRLGVRRPASLFRCARSGEVWPRSVLGCAPHPPGLRTLEPVSAEDLDRDPRVGRQRRELFDDALFARGLWAEEHSAQLSAAENRRLQDLFRIGARNLLSATTTLELGVDIGGLNGVFLANVPPGLANYQQRGGRAGRRADGSSVVLTLARSRPYDREVFLRLGDFLQRPLRPPLLIGDRERVAFRHLDAFLLGRFFQELRSPDEQAGAMR
ncbi:MAG: DEAD/DEAH box helicase, partial [Planctomycetota bacterium]